MPRRPRSAVPPPAATVSTSPPSPVAVTAAFAERLLVWFDTHGRHDLPWQHPREPYRVWLAEVMLQQTQVATVIPYFARFIARFPDWRALAAAPLDEVLTLWAGLGYYARARNLHRAAQTIVATYDGIVPQDLTALQALPGLGRSTAAAILAQAYDQRHAILDGNVKRVLARHAAVDGWPGVPLVTRRLWHEAEARLPSQRFADYTQAIMDLGATLCTPRQPACLLCPVAADCRARIENRVTALPSPRPRRARPQKCTQLLLIEDSDGAVLLERRAPVGIWGGLWCPPLLEPDEDWRSRLQPICGAEAELVGHGASVWHAFTHFDLEIRPLHLRLRTDRSGALAERPGQRWITLPSEDWPGLPAPVRTLLQAHLQRHIQD